MESEIVSSSQWKVKASLGAFLVLALSSAGARAQEPTPAALNYANQILVDTGMKTSLDRVVPGMLGQLEHNVTATRPELKDPLHATLLAIEPEFVKTEEGVLAGSAKFLASQMTEQELKDTAGFYESATGKKYIITESALMNDVTTRAGAWRQQLSTEIVTRAREEMKKKGYEF
jgi:hypothetical protein